MLFVARGRFLWICLAVLAVPAFWSVAAALEPAASDPEEGAASEPVESEPSAATADDDGEAVASEPDSDSPANNEPHLATPPADESPPPSEQPPEESPADPSTTLPDDGSQPTDAPAKLPAAPDEAEPGKIKEDALENPPRRGAIDPASLKGVRPGQTTRESLHAEWGRPKQVDKFAGGFRETFEVKPFDKVRVTIIDDVVDSLAVYLEKPVALKVIAKQLQVDDVEPVDVLDEQGRLVGQAYPERGVMFGFAQNSTIPRVFQIVVEPIDAQPFLDRASQRLENRFTDCLEDLKQALELAPNAMQARWLHAELTLRAGDLEQALGSAEQIVERSPDELEYRLTLAKILAATGDYAQAIKHAQTVAESGGAEGVVAARAHCQWGDCLAAAEKHDYQQAIEHHLKAIELAEPLAASPVFAVRRAAKQLLVDAHLAVAYGIGWGRWQQKSKVVPKWIDRATAFADHLIANEHVSFDVRLRVHEKALAALAGIAEPPDASRWVRGLTELGKKMFDEAGDPAYKAHLAWRLGVALNDAVEIEATRKQLDNALALGRLGLDFFEQGQPAGKQLPSSDYLRGRLCYRLGAAFAVEKSDHKQAIGWFDRAVPLLESPVPAATVDCGKQGETFVSMAVSYWAVNRRDEAVRLTNQGVKLMEQAASEGLLDKAALAIPYGNLSSMHQELGDDQEAKKYSELAVRHDEKSKQ